mgnify:CR=1 FL=1
MSKKIKKTIFLVLIVFIILIIDFSFFYKKITISNQKHINGNNLVVLTGGNFRIKKTLELFMASKKNNFNLLISGAGKGFNKNTLSKLIPVNKNFLNKISCCIDIENKSTDTLSNATETLNWIIKNQYKSITLITSAYHMPRALIEFKSILIGIKITPFALNDNVSFDVLTFEYLKFLITKLRIVFFSIYNFTFS